VIVEGDPTLLAGESSYFELWIADGVLRRSHNLGDSDLERDPASGTIRPVTLRDGSDGRQITLRVIAHREPFDHRTGPGTTVTLVVARPTAELSREITQLAGVLVGAGIFGTLLCLAILFGAVRFGLAPVRSLAAAIAELREGDLAVKLDAARTPRELAPVVDRLDDLLRRLSAAFTRERELTAEVAHELRTPIAGLRATIEVAISKDDRPAEKYRAALADCLAITRQTERLVETMLSLARLDAGTARAAQEPVDLDELLRECVATIGARASDREVAVVTTLPAVTAFTDRDKLQRVLENLLDNAVSYVDDGGTIDVALAPGTITISNSGCTLAPEEVANVFQRFWRGDAARSDGMHVGLGLALCKKLVHLLGGTITARVEAGTFSVTVVL